MKTRWGVIPVVWIGVAIAFAVGVLLGGYFFPDSGIVEEKSVTVVPLLPNLDRSTLDSKNQIVSVREELKPFSNPEYGISFSYPAKYILSSLGYEEVLPLLMYEDPNKTVPDFIDVSWLPFKPTDSPEQVLINDVYYDGSGAHPKSFDDFKLVRLGYNDFYKIRTGVFEGVMGYRYYLIKEEGAFVFRLTSNNVPWTDPKYSPENDPRNLELQEMLKTVRLNN